MPDLLGDFTYTWPFYAALVAGYLLGSVPFGLVLTRLAGLGDIRDIGSGNIGTTNVLRTGRKDLALATLILDSGKGGIAVLIAGHLYGQDMAIMAGTGAFLGHLFPVWLRFQGGKGVATFLGTVAAISWPAGLVACATWLVVALIFRFSSLAALAATAATPVAAWYLADPQRMEFTLLLAALVWFRHRENIKRLITGDEPKIGKKNKS
mgnify:CR=1 FL=1